MGTSAFLANALLPVAGEWSAVDIYRVTGGKISEEWAADDIATIMTQIGAFNPPWLHQSSSGSPECSTPTLR